VQRRFDRYGDIYYAPSAGVGLYVLRHPDHIWEVLVRDGAKYGKTHTAFDQLKRFLGEGLLTTDGEAWRRQRRMVNPAFTKGRLEGYAAAMVDESLATRDAWRDGDRRDLSREMMELTLRIVCQTLFSHDVGGRRTTWRWRWTAFATSSGGRTSCRSGSRRRIAVARATRSPRSIGSSTA
jgi:cytochrome P450